MRRLRSYLLLCLCLITSLYRLSAEGLGAVIAPRIATIPLHGGGEGSVRIAFDRLSSDNGNIAYRIRHCSPEGTSEVLAHEASLVGFSEGNIYGGEQSYGTAIDYIHYELSLPNQDWQPRYSGRYVLEVYAEETPDKVLFSKDLYVYESLIAPEIQTSPDSPHGARGKYQYLNIRLSLPESLRSIRPDELTLLVYQNASTTIAPLRLSRPSAMRGNSWHYHKEDEARFLAGSEYLRIEHTDKRGYGQGIERRERDTLITPTIIANREAAYHFVEDRNGIALIRSTDVHEVATEGEYHWVRFAVEAPKGEEIYLDGEAFEYLPREARKLRYQGEATGLYTLTLPLKNGYQEYRYVDAKGQDIRGDHHETSNEYTVLAFYKAPTERYTRLIGISSAKTR